jgi:hypothetical protein
MMMTMMTNDDDDDDDNVDDDDGDHLRVDGAAGEGGLRAVAPRVLRGEVHLRPSLLGLGSKMITNTKWIWQQIPTRLQNYEYKVDLETNTN